MSSPSEEKDVGDVAKLIERATEAMAGLNPLTGYSEDALWRPANRAWKALYDIRSALQSAEQRATKLAEELERRPTFSEFEKVQRSETDYQKRWLDAEAQLAGVVEAARPFVAAYDIQPPGHEDWPDERGAREWLPGAWPDTGDFRRLREALASINSTAPVEQSNADDVQRTVRGGDEVRGDAGTAGSSRVASGDASGEGDIRGAEVPGDEASEPDPRPLALVALEGLVQSAFREGEYALPDLEDTLDYILTLYALPAQDVGGLEATVTELSGLLAELVAVVRGECPSLLNEDSGGYAYLAVAIEAALSPRPVQPQAVPDDIARLVIAARIVAHEDQGKEALTELDQAVEEFASRVPWDDEPVQPQGERS